MEPSPCALPCLELSKRHQEHDLKHLGAVDLITIKQNKTRCVIHNGAVINLISTIDIYDKLVIARRFFL
jgi:hypothetical protein